MATNRSSLNKEANYGSATSLIASSTSSAINLSDDTDENKYKRKSALAWLARWWKNTMGGPMRGRRSTKQRYMMFAFIGLLAFLTLIVVFHYLGRSGDSDDFHGDPMLDPMNNPNIRIGIH